MYYKSPPPQFCIVTQKLWNCVVTQNHWGGDVHMVKILNFNMYLYNIGFGWGVGFGTLYLNNVLKAYSS